VDLARYSKDEYKKLLADLVQYEDFVTEVNVAKQIRGGKLPSRVYTVVIMEPDAINLKELDSMKKQQNAPPNAQPKVVVERKDDNKEIGTPKK